MIKGQKFSSLRLKTRFRKITMENTVNEKKVRIKAKKKRREESKKENKQIKTGREITRLITACTKEKEKRKAHIVDRDRE